LSTPARPAVLTGSIIPVAGNGTKIYGGDGMAAANTGLQNPINVSVDSAGNVFITDGLMHSVLRVATGTGLISRVAGPAKLPAGVQSGDGGPGTAVRFLDPLAALADTAGNLYIADGYGAIRKLAPSGIITSLLRDQAAARFNFSRDAAVFNTVSAFRPAGLALDASGNLYIADAYNECIRKFTLSSGTVNTVAASCDRGANGQGFAGDGEPAASAKFAGPSGVALDAAGNLYIRYRKGGLWRRRRSGG
jgi:sugar lactone lactonase YvrE